MARLENGYTNRPSSPAISTYLIRTPLKATSRESRESNLVMSTLDKKDRLNGFLRKTVHRWFLSVLGVY